MIRRVLLVVLLLASCRPCDFRVQGACVDYDAGDGLSPPPGAQEQWEEAVSRSREFWGLEPDALDGWTVVVHRGPVRCFLFWEKEGCTNGPLGEIHVQSLHGCASLMLPHELGHLAHPWDAGHRRGAWDDIDRAAWDLGACEYERQPP